MLFVILRTMLLITFPDNFASTPKVDMTVALLLTENERSN